MAARVRAFLWNSATFLLLGALIRPKLARQATELCCFLPYPALPFPNLPFPLLPPNPAQQTPPSLCQQDMPEEERSDVLLEGAFFVLGPGGSQTNVNKRRNVNVKVVGPNGKEMFNELRVFKEK